MKITDKGKAVTITERVCPNCKKPAEPDVVARYCSATGRGCDLNGPHPKMNWDESSALKGKKLKGGA